MKPGILLATCIDGALSPEQLAALAEAAKPKDEKLWAQLCEAYEAYMRLEDEEASERKIQAAFDRWMRLQFKYDALKKA